MADTFFYIQIDTFAIFSLLIIVDYGKYNLLDTSQKLFKLLTMSTIIELISDMLGWILDGKVFLFSGVVLQIVTAVNWAFALLPGLFWLYYCSSQISEKFYKKWRWLFAVPVLIGLIFLAINPFTHWIYTIDPSGLYIREKYFLLVMMQPFLNVFLSIFILLYHARGVPFVEKNKYHTLILFTCIPMAGAIIQISVYGAATMWTALTIGILMCYVFIQKGDVHTDPLTRINNRRRFDTYVPWILKNRNAYDALYIIIIDIDNFKKINDKYGHIEGDRALIEAVGILKKAISSRKSCFLSRIGGDEFSIVVTKTNEYDVKGIIAQIERESQIANQKAERPYDIEFSVGSAGVDEKKSKSFEELYDEADAAMYSMKKLKQCGNGK